MLLSVYAQAASHAILHITSELLMFLHHSLSVQLHIGKNVMCEH